MLQKLATEKSAEMKPVNCKRSDGFRYVVRLVTETTTYTKCENDDH
jgi:hypothetical protein